jgi:hypothetical protein
MANGLLPRDSGDPEDADQGAGLELAVVDGDRQRTTLLRMNQDVVAAANTIEVPPGAFECTNQILRLDRRQSSAHAD